MHLFSVSSYCNKEGSPRQEIFIMKRTTPLQKYAAQFRYEHKNMNDRFSGVKKHASELSKLLDGMFPKDKKEKEKK